MVVLTIELFQGSSGVLTDRGEHLSQPFQVCGSEHLAAVFGNEHQVDVKVVD